VREAAENRDALAAQARRTEQTTPADVDQPVQPSDANRQGGMNAGSPGMVSSASSGTSSSGTSGMSASGSASSNRTGADATRAAAENRDALADEARRVEQTLPPDVDTTGRR
jgi:hypothetical protein